MLKTLTVKRVTALIAFCGMLLMVGCGNAATTASSTATVAPTATAAVAALPNSFTSPSGLFKLTYPTDWQHVGVPTGSIPVTDGTVFTSADAQDGFIVTPLTTAVPASGYSAYMQSFFTSFGGTDVTVAASLQTVTIGENTWTTNTATLTVKGVASTATQYILQHNGNPFIVEVFAPSANVSTIATTEFQPMLASLTILK